MRIVLSIFLLITLSQSAHATPDVNEILSVFDAGCIKTKADPYWIGQAANDFEHQPHWRSTLPFPEKAHDLDRIFATSDEHKDWWIVRENDYNTKKYERMYILTSMRKFFDGKTNNACSVLFTGTSVTELNAVIVKQYDVKLIGKERDGPNDFYSYSAEFISSPADNYFITIQHFNADDKDGGLILLVLLQRPR